VDEISSNVFVVANCDPLPELPKDWLRCLLKMHLKTKRDNKFLKLIHVNGMLQICLRREGIDTTFRIAQDLRDALHETGLAPKRTLDTEFINPFLIATVHVLKVQSQIEATPGQVYM
jgi:hypothetical protein